MSPIARLRPLGLALTIYDIYRRLPPSQRRQLLDLMRRHGPKVASAAVARSMAARAARSSRKR